MVAVVERLSLAEVRLIVLNVFFIVLHIEYACL